MAEEKPTCPKCGKGVSKDDNFCRNCGADIRMPSRPLVPPQPTIGPVPEIPPPYKRKFGMIRRLYGALLKPDETMKDIALSPDYWGVIVILILQLSLMVADFSLVFSKFHFEGQYSSQIGSMVSAFIGIAVTIAIVLFPLRWLVKSVIVWKACDSGSMWSFKIAASVTGYAYVVDLVIGIVSSLFLSFFIPELTINTTDLDVARKMMDEYMLKITSLKLYLLPISLGTILWKSYLGGIGTHHGTKQICTKALGTLVFLLLSLVGLLINYLTT